MAFFGDENDPFEEIVREFFGSSPRGRNVQNKSRFISGEEEERNIDFVETPNNFFVVFELPGFEKQDVKLSIRGNQLVVEAKKKPLEKVQPYLFQKLSNGINIVKTLPDFIKTKNYDYTFSNGVLEVKFRK